MLYLHLSSKGLRTLPTELICKILSYTSVRDVVRWRSVSKSFCAIASKSEIWKALHASTPMRPPELLPIPSHERALAKSERLAQSWSQELTQLRIMSCTNFPYMRSDSEVAFVGDMSLIGGRWLIACQYNMKFVLYDTHLDPKTFPQDLRIVGNMISWYPNSVRFMEGRWVMYVEVRTKSPARPWILLGLGWDAESGKPCGRVDLDIPCTVAKNSRRYYMEDYVSPHSRFIYLKEQALVFDTTTQAFYAFPAFGLALDQTKSRIDPTSLESYSRIMFTNTHLIVLTGYSWDSERTGYPIIPILVQAFSIPGDQHPARNVAGVLLLSHEGVFENKRGTFNVIRNPIVNPNDGSINVRLLGSNCPCTAYCVDLTLHQPSPAGVSPMTITQHDIVARSRTSREDSWHYHYSRWDISDEGYARGLTLWDSQLDDPDSIQTWEVTKFAIDATGDQCVLSFASVFRGGTEIPQIVRRDSVPHLDGERGKLYYYTYNDMVVADVE